MSNEQAKIAAGQYAASLVEDGQKVGLGSGTSAWHFIRSLASRVDDGLDIIAVPASKASRDLALELNIPLTELDDIDGLDICIDGADEVAPDGSMIKGGGANLLWEKIIAVNSKKMLSVVDPSKIVSSLGVFPLPIEVTPAYYGTTMRNVRELLDYLGWTDPLVERRLTDGQPLVTDNDNFIIDAHLGVINDPETLAVELNTIPGVVENGLFPVMSDGVIVGTDNGTAKFLELGFDPKTALD